MQFCLNWLKIAASELLRQSDDSFSQNFVSNRDYSYWRMRKTTLYYFKGSAHAFIRLGGSNAERLHLCLVLVKAL